MKHLARITLAVLLTSVVAGSAAAEPLEPECLGNQRGGPRDADVETGFFASLWGEFLALFYR